MIRLKVNGKNRAFRGAPFTRLIDVLREDLRLTGTKEGCGEGECGACTVLVDGAAVCSCLIPVCQASGSAVETVESLGTIDKLSPLQQGFLRQGGAQCGICTPGMLMAATGWLRRGGGTDAESVRCAIAGNLCRCTGYQHIVDSVIASVKSKSRGRKLRGSAKARRGRARK